MQVLIVDTSVHITQRLEELLSDLQSVGKIHKAFSYEEAWELFQSNKFSIVLLDSGLRENGTIRLLKNLKEAGSNATIFILSSSYDDNILKECKSCGVDFIFDKYNEFDRIPGVINGIEGKPE